MSRLDAVRHEMGDLGINALLITNRANCRYLSGFTGADVSLLLAPGINGIAVDPRYVVQAQHECPDWQLINIRGDIAEWFPPVARQHEAVLWGVESDSLSLLSYQRLTESLAHEKCDLQVKPISGLVQKLRILKEPGELESIRVACRVVDQALADVVKAMHKGMTEKQLAWLIERTIRDQGSEGMPFEVIVASGPNSAMPHAIPSDRVILPGEPVLIDCGARVNGYCSDITRTYCFGEPDDKFKSTYTAVLGAQLTTLAVLKAGMTGKEADQMARAVLQECRLEEYFQHGLGHGIGLEVHELPRVGSRSEDLLPANAVFTIEPGVYLPGWGGIRIEDTVVMEDGGVKVLTTSSKEPMLLDDKS